MRKILTILVLIAGFILTIQSVSNSFDGDFGWHLRFGQDAWTGNFPYLDSYTWPHLGQPWTNHEWGGDVLFWFLYDNFGYFSLVILISTLLFASVIFIQKIFVKKIDLTAATMAFLSIWLLKFLIVMRLAMLAPLFFVIIIWTLEKIPEKKYYYLWPIIFWLWAALHGSWILGFIVINIYIAGAILFLILNKYRPQFAGQQINWSVKSILTACLFQFLSLAAICLNPYGIKILREVLLYFTENYYKQFITEWIPSYSYPVYAGPLILAAVASVFLTLAYLKKRVTAPQALLFFAIFYSAMQYKRNNLYLVLICAPILADTLRQAITQLKHAGYNFPKYLRLAVFPLTVFFIFFYGTKIHYTNDIWEHNALFARSFGLPDRGVNFLREKSAGKKIQIFNEFWWGGFINWTLPNALVYLDGRGTATWHYNEKETMLEHYRKIRYEAGGMKEIDNLPVQFVMLEKSRISNSKVNTINSLIFPRKDLDEVLSANPPQLEKMLNKNKKWKLVYSDAICNIWERIK